MNEKPQSSSKRGRKPVGASAMTATERKRLSRSRKAAEGSVEFMLRLRGETLDFIDQTATATGVSRSQVVEEFLNLGIAQFAAVQTEALQMHRAGASDDEVVQRLRQAIRVTSAPEAIAAYKETTDIE